MILIFKRLSDKFIISVKNIEKKVKPIYQDYTQILFLYDLTKFVGGLQKVIKFILQSF